MIKKKNLKANLKNSKYILILEINRYLKRIDKRTLKIKFLVKLALIDLICSLDA